MQDTWKFITRHTVVIPYDATRTDLFPETYLVSLYMQLKEEGLLPLIFPGCAITHLNHFVKYFTDIRHPLVIGMALKDGEVSEPIGIGWIAEVEGQRGARKGSLGYGFFRKFWGSHLLREAAWNILDYWFYGLDIDILYGTALNANGLAKNFSKRFGFTNLCILPKFFYSQGELVEASLMCLDRVTFDERYEKWLASSVPRAVAPQSSKG